MGLNILRRWRRGSQQPAPTAAPDSFDGTTLPLSDPAELLDAQQRRLRGLRLESGYSHAGFQSFIHGPLLQCARYVHRLPASRAASHREPGGLFRLAFETACVAFRRADGRLFSGPRCTGESSRDSDRAWRYAAFIAGLYSPLGRAHGALTVHSPDDAQRWNPHATGLWCWAQAQQLDGYRIAWRHHPDARPMQPDSLWIAARLLGPDVIERLSPGDDASIEALIDVLGGRGGNALSELVAAATQAVVDQDLAAARAANDLPTTGIRVEHRLVDAMRGLVRDTWTSNTGGSRVWITEQGVFLNWRPAVNDILMRLRSDGVTGLPKDPDSLAELLVENAVLARNPTPASPAALPHYFRLVIHAPQVPKHPMDCVRLVSAGLLGLPTDTQCPLQADIAGYPQVSDAGSAQGPREYHPDRATPATDSADTAGPAEKPNAPTAPASQPGAAPLATTATKPVQAPMPSTLARYGLAGQVLEALTTQRETVFFPMQEGIALAYPGAIENVCPRPTEFLMSCQA